MLVWNGKSTTRSWKYRQRELSHQGGAVRRIGGGREEPLRLNPHDNRACEAGSNAAVLLRSTKRIGTCAKPNFCARDFCGALRRIWPPSANPAAGAPSADKPPAPCQLYPRRVPNGTLLDRFACSRKPMPRSIAPSASPGGCSVREPQPRSWRTAPWRARGTRGSDGCSAPRSSGIPDNRPSAPCYRA